MDFEGILSETSRLTKTCQNEEKLNGACGTVIGMFLQDSLSRAIMLLINTEQWSSDKAMIRPTSSEAKLDSFAETGKKF